VAIEEVMTKLLGCMEIFNTIQAVEIREEDERLAREAVIREQNQAYEESLRMDIAKDEAKKAALAEKQREADEKIAETARTQVIFILV